MAAGFFNIHMLARLAGHNGCRGMPMIRRGDNNGVNVLLFQQLADIGYPFRFFSCALINIGDGACHYIGVDIADIPDFYIWYFCKVLGEIKPPAMCAHHADHHLIIWRPFEKTRSLTQLGRQQETCTGYRCGFNELSTIDHIFGLLSWIKLDWVD